MICALRNKEIWENTKTRKVLRDFKGLHYCHRASTAFLIQCLAPIQSLAARFVVPLYFLYQILSQFPVRATIKAKRSLTNLQRNEKCCLIILGKTLLDSRSSNETVSAASSPFIRTFLHSYLRADHILGCSIITLFLSYFYSLNSKQDFLQVEQLSEITTGFDILLLSHKASFCQ